MPDTMKIKSLANWFGSNRVNAEAVGVQLGKLDWCGIAFMGGGPEIPHIRTRGGVANDLHRHIVNLARCVATRRAELSAILEGMIFHPDELARAQRICIEREADEADLFGESKPRAGEEPDAEWGAAYFACCWMGRGGEGGKTGELQQPLSTRWTSSGGSSARRFQSAIDSLDAWREALKGWEFSCMDGLAFLDRCKDQPGHGVYIDSPWPDAGKDYKHRVDDRTFHRKLFERAVRFKSARVVIRYGDHPLIRGLHEQLMGDGWTMVKATTRTQANTECDEFLLVNGPSYGEGK